MKEDYTKDKLEDEGIVLGPNEGEKYSFGPNSFTFKVTSESSKNQLGVYEIVLGPMAIGAKLHYHRFMDETFIVIQGRLTVQMGDEEYEASPGTVAYAPRFTPHGFRNDTEEEVKLILVFNPSSNREGFFRGLKDILTELPIDGEKYLKLYNKYDSFPVDSGDMIPTRE
ncbi:cupin domain-containing protein [Membranihabitans marinus]|uniref:cupin domain-containing protein n=1 Tax=Membranihabitans marinus TaxID=1227546 RepID=UPI001F1F1C80|nr:cupin domain-containing protein [Membranihabitans marinus]